MLSFILCLNMTLQTHLSIDLLIIVCDIYHKKCLIDDKKRLKIEGEVRFWMSNACAMGHQSKRLFVIKRGLSNDFKSKSFRGRHSLERGSITLSKDFEFSSPISFYRRLVVLLTGLLRGGNCPNWLVVAKYRRYSHIIFFLHTRPYD